MDRSVRRPNRLPHFDYSQAGYYFVTICAREKRHLFWASVGATCGRPPLSAIGQIVERELATLDHAYPMVHLDKYVIMQNHLHLIIRLSASKDGRPQVAPTLSRVIQQFKGAVTKAVGLPLWQKSFHDHIIRSEADYLRVWQYIDTNPLKWEQDKYYTPVVPLSLQI